MDPLPADGGLDLQPIDSGLFGSPPPPEDFAAQGNNSSAPAATPPEGNVTPESPPPQQETSPPASNPPPPPESPPPAPSNSSPPPQTAPPPPPPAEDQSSPPPPPQQEVQPSPSPPSPPQESSSNPPPNDPTPPPKDSISPPAQPQTTGNQSPTSPSFGPPSSNVSFGFIDSHSPPPPLSSSKNSPARSSSAPPPYESSSSSSNANAVIIAGIAVAGVVALAFIIIFLVCSKKKKKQPYYYNGGRPGQDPYYNGTPGWNNDSQSMEHVVKLPPPPGVMGTPVGGGAGGTWGFAPPAPLPLGHSSGEYSSGYSDQHHPHLPPLSPVGGMGGFSKSQFTYEDLATATAGFSQANLLGQGGFGYVHKGVLPDGKVVAVKSLKSGSGQGEREFQAEVEIISRVHHRHLVSLVGYCIADSQRMLVYEFVSNSTLEHHLHGKGRPVMEWSSRTRITLGSAKGLAYLHEDCYPRIIHRDIKAANILLDDNYEAMVADFGLAKLTSDNYTHVSTRVMGTFGYLAPEYASSGKLTEKSDVFSFGVMLLELITGRQPVDFTGKIMEDSLVDWARPLLTKALEDGNYDELADPRMEGNYDTHEMARMIACASASIRHSARRRPKMSQIVRALEGDTALEDLNEGAAKPNNGQSSSSGNSSLMSGHDSAYDTGAYNADMMKFRNMVLNSQEFASSEYGATSEYGLNPSSSSSDSKDMDAQSGPQRLKN